MRGFLFMALGLTALEVLLKAPTTRVAVALSTPSALLAKWMDPHTPLISKPVPAAGASNTPNPAGQNTNALGESKTGACPPGFPPGIKCLGM